MSLTLLAYMPLSYLFAAVDPVGDSGKVADRAALLYQHFLDFLEAHAAAYLSGLAVMVVGYFVSRWVGHAVASAVEKQTMEPPVRLLLVRMARLAVFTVSLIVALGAAGFQIAALATGLGVVGVGIGLGMQGLLSNVVAGLAIIFTRPFRVGEYIEIVGVQGLVKHIDLISTTLLHGDNSRVIIPNHKIIGEILHNFGNTRQLDLSVGVSYGADLKKVLALVNLILAANPRVLKEPAPAVTVTALGDSAINIAIKPWAALDDVGVATTELNAAIHEQFRATGLEIPIPQREIHIMKAV